MRILLDIGHPAHIHLFRNTYFSLSKEGHKVFVSTKNNLDNVQVLLNYYKIPFIAIGSKSDNIISSASEVNSRIQTPGC